MWATVILNPKGVYLSVALFLFKNYPVLVLGAIVLSPSKLCAVQKIPSPLSKRVAIK